MEQLGIQPQALVTQVVNFTILLVVLTKFLYKPILKTLDKRKKEIEEGVALTEKLRLEEEKLSQKREKVLDEARGQARQILEEAKAAGKGAERDMVATAQSEASEIIEKAKADAKHIHDSLGEEIRKESAKLAAEMTSRILSGLSSSEQHKIIARQIKELPSSLT